MGHTFVSNWGIRVCLFLLIFCQVYSGVTSFSLKSAICDTVSSTGNFFANLNSTQTLTNSLTSVVSSTLNILSQDQVANASAYTRFLLFTRESGDNFTRVLLADQEAILEAGFCTLRNTKILIHGWTGSGTDRYIVTVRNAFLEKEDINIIVVDWPKLAQQPYSVAFTAVPYVGAHTASFIDFLVQDVGVDISTIHVIGFSLGAHIAGVAGKTVNCGQLPWITGLDPAGPLFTKTNTKTRLDHTDACFVDAIHTSAGSVGYADCLATVDFYPNGGYAPQPGASLQSDSHGRAFEYYAESVASREFIATQCDCYKSYLKGDECANHTQAVMGYHVDHSSRGKYYLKTNAKSPFALGAEF